MKRILCAALLFAAACSSEPSPIDRPDSGMVPVDTPPAWAGPARIEVPEGDVAVLPIAFEDAEGDEVLVAEVSTTSSVSADLVSPGGSGAPNEISISAPVGAASSVLTIEGFDTKGNAVAVNVDVDVSPLRWQTLPAGLTPEAREHPAVIYDGARDRVVIIGGSGYSPYGEGFDDIWALDLDTGLWSEIQGAGPQPAPGGSRRVAQIPGTSTALVYGGYGESGAPEDGLFRVDYLEETLLFERISQAGDAPAGLALHAFFYDETSGKFYAFGGFDRTGVTQNGVWSLELDGTTGTWTKHELSNPPSPRYGFFYAFDPGQRALFVFSGAQGLQMVDAARDLWRLDVSTDPMTWTMVGQGREVPAERRNGAFVFDPRGPRLWVFGGTHDARTTRPGLWSIDLITYETLEVMRDAQAPIRSSGAGVFDPVRTRILIGFGNSSSAAYDTFVELGYE